MPPTGELSYDVVVVKRPEGLRTHACRETPAAADEIATIVRDIPGWAAAAFCRGFNEAEGVQPYGVWAVMRRRRPLPADNGRERPGH